MRLKGRWFETHRRHCVVSLNKILYPLFSTGSTQEGRKSSRLDCKIVDWDVKHQHNQSLNAVKPVLSSHSKKDQNLVLKTDHCFIYYAG